MEDAGRRFVPPKQRSRTPAALEAIEWSRAAAVGHARARAPPVQFSKVIKTLDESRFCSKVKINDSFLNLQRRKMDSSALISLALRALKCSQKQLAVRLGVSEGQI